MKGRWEVGVAHCRDVGDVDKREELLPEKPPEHVLKRHDVVVAFCLPHTCYASHGRRNNCAEHRVVLGDDLAFSGPGVVTRGRFSLYRL